MIHDERVRFVCLDSPGVFLGGSPQSVSCRLCRIGLTTIKRLGVPWFNMLSMSRHLEKLRLSDDPEGLSLLRCR